MILRYGGPDVVDLKQADWVELVDSDNRTIRIAFAEQHAPAHSQDGRDRAIRGRKGRARKSNTTRTTIRLTVSKRRFKSRASETASKYFQVFFDKCDYNTSVSDALFTKESLDQRWAQIPNRDKVRDKKDLDRQKEKEKDDKDSDKDSKN